MQMGLCCSTKIGRCLALNMTPNQIFDDFYLEGVVVIVLISSDVIDVAVIAGIAVVVGVVAVEEGRVRKVSFHFILISIHALKMKEKDFL